MRLGSLALLALLFGGPAAAVAGPAEDFRAGNEAFWNGDFPAAATAYHRVVDAGVQNADVYYNLGTAEAEAGRLGYAIWALEQAVLLRPDHADAAHNLEQARGLAMREGLAGGSEQRVILPGDDDVGTGLFTALSPSTLTALFVAVWALLFACLVAVRRAPPGGWRTAFGFAAVLAGLGSMAAGGLLAGRVLIVNRAQYGVVVTDRVSVVAGPGEKYRSVANVLAGVKVRVRGQDADWVHVTLADGADGWLKTGQIERLRQP